MTNSRRLPVDEHHPVARTMPAATRARWRPGRPRPRAAPRSGVARRPPRAPSVSGTSAAASATRRGDVGRAAWRRSLPQRVRARSGPSRRPLTPLGWPGDARQNARAASTCSSVRRWPARPPPPPRRWRRAPDPQRPRARRRSSTSTTRSCRAPASSTWPAGCTAASSSPPGRSSGAAWKQAYFRIVGVEDPEHVAEARNSALELHRRPHRRRARGAGRGDLRRGHGAPDLARAPARSPSCTSTRASGSGW